jgi:3alpha(or 20beta)-hydroxysteroid dehydrogenase
MIASRLSGRLNGKIALVTGAAQGMGLATARLFAGQGAVVHATDIRDDLGEEAFKDLAPQVTYEPLDVTSEADWDRVTKGIASRHGRLDVLVNNAGVAHQVPLAEMSLPDFMHIIMVNEVGVFLGMRASIPLLRAAASGASIINVSSIAAMSATDLGQGAYAASKWAVTGMSKVAAAELGPFGIRVNTVHPGHLRTPMSNEVKLNLFAERNPLKRVGQPEEQAALLLFLASDESSYSTGSEFYADGGSRIALYQPDKGWQG